MKINLKREYFTFNKSDFVEYGNFKIKAFKYNSGVEAFEINNEKCSFVFTPFKGQQIWHFCVGGKEISMQTTVKEPVDTMTYLQNYGGFLYHCGIISFGAPDSEHPHHGEIPNAIYDEAYIICDEDEKGKYIILGGSLNHDTAFVRKYKFAPEIKLYENNAVFQITVNIENLRAYPLEYMYLCHLNFKPIDGAELICSAKYDSEHLKIYRTDGSDKLIEYFDKLENNPEIMNRVGNEHEFYDPEICFGIKYDGDENNRAYTLQYTDEGACYVSHPTDVLKNGVRWISRTANEDSMGMVLPATGEHLGYANAKEKGQIQILEPNGKISFLIEAGYLEKEEAEAVKNKIYDILK